MLLEKPLYEINKEPDDNLVLSNSEKQEVEEADRDRDDQEMTDTQKIATHEQKFLLDIAREYQRALARFPENERLKKERVIADSYNQLKNRISAEMNEFGERRQTVLKLKLARYFQNNEQVDSNTLYDALIESPRFLDTAKGSLHHLFEVHEQKTLISIAEWRKQKAEQGEGTINPYEALLTTGSGKYYLARLLNMPHLNDESEYMKLCLGNSTSYINRMKRGEIEILSFRKMPTIDPVRDTRDGDDTPIVTIEYNLKTKNIEQIKKYDNKYLSLEDPFFEEVVDALGQMEKTVTDAGVPRKIKLIRESELPNIAVRDSCVLTVRGEISFRDYDPEKDGFILKAGKLEISRKTPKEDAAKILQIVEGIKIEAEAVAYNLWEINSRTRAYIGSLVPGIFSEVPPELEHIYVSFPDNKIHFSDVEFGGKSVTVLERELKDRHIMATPLATSMLRSPEFVSSPHTEKATVVRLTGRDLGFSKLAITNEVYARAQKLGLELCPHDLAVQHRVDYQDPREYDTVNFAMPQISDSDGHLAIFMSSNDEDRPWLSSSWAKWDDNQSSWNSWIFLLRKK